jgi:hypothetical protein
MPESFENSLTDSDSFISLAAPFQTVIRKTN